MGIMHNKNYFDSITFTKNDLKSGTLVLAQTFFQDYPVNIAATVTKFSGCL